MPLVIWKWGFATLPSGYAREGQEYAVLGLHYKDLSGRG